ncbi:MAG: hypothetical protein ABUS48_03130 [Pseudomonadota bacterium]
MIAVAGGPDKKKYGLRETVMALGQPRVALMFALGFSSGLPFLLTGATFGYWLREAGTELAAIGFISWVGLAYTFKFLWSPLIDKMPAPLLGRLGRRRGWAMLMQLVIAAALIGMAILGPHGPGGLATLGALALLVAVASASQDTAVDAWRIETARDPDELGLLTSSFTLGFRVALLITDAVILILAQHLSWPIAYVLMAVLMSVGLFAASRTPEPKHVAPTAAAAEAERIAIEQKAPASRLDFSAALFWFAAAATYVFSTGDVFAGQSDPVHVSLIGVAFSIAYAICALCSIFGAALISWVLGVAAFAIMIGIGFYAAAVGVDVIHAPHIFYAVAAGFIATALVAPPKIYNSVAGPFIEFFRAHGQLALLMLVTISLYRLPEFVIGPVAGPFYVDLGLTKDVVGTVRGTIGLVGSFAGIAVGGLCVLRLGYMRSLILGAVLQGLGVAGYAMVATYGPDMRLFSFVMAWDNFCYAFAGVALVTYMSSLTSLGFTATQYALMSSLYTAVGKVLKGFSGVAVEGFHQTHTLMQSYALFYTCAGLIAAPALVLCVVLARRTKRMELAPAPA